jgi:DNA-binding SARP family transcriptional activator
VARGGAWARWTRLLDVAGAALTAVLTFLAVPAVLVLVVGNPLSGGLGHTWQPASRDALCVLVAAAWVAWAVCCAQLVRAVVLRVRRGEVGVRAGASMMDRIAARIALGVVAVTTLGVPVVLSSGAGATTPAAAHVGVPTTPAGRTAGRATLPASPAARAYFVQPGDTLWTIADTHEGDGADWTSLAVLNLGRDMDDGTRFVDPDHLRPGWRLGLPPAGGDRSSDAALKDRRPARGALPDHLPELVALGVGSLACAALARRTRRRREHCRLADLPELPPPLSDGAIDAATLLNRFDRVPALDSFEAANCLLGRVLHEREAPVPDMQAVCVGPAGVTFLLVSPDLDAPPGFTSTEDGAAWRVDHHSLRDPAPFRPHLPVVLPVGDDDEGTWLIPLGPGGVLPLLGESGPMLWQTARSVQESWSWADQVLVTDDPDEPARALSQPAATGPATTPPVLFFGDPTHLSREVADQTAVVTTAAVAATGVTVLVDRHGASIHPVGRLVRPHVFTGALGAHVEELVARPQGPSDHPATADRSPVAPSARATRSEVTGPAALFPGPIDVRLLTTTPRLDGLAGDLPANRARRAVELVAYLALHHPDVVTSDRLRTRVLGSSDADAAAKTLFNTAYAARRAMGVDDKGDPLFPGASRTGLYHVSPLVTVDVHRAVALADEGRACADSTLAMAHFRTALELVEGEPLANALAGYSWWEAEGHGGRIAAVLVDAACRLAALAVEAELFDLARLGLEKARLVEPYSEGLSRAAMQVAAAEGDADRLRREWMECQRRVDALDPGSSPSPRTENLYGELARRVSVDHRTGRVERYAPAAND